MSNFKGKDFSGKRVELDGNKYENCKFVGSHMTYSGGQPPDLLHCDCSQATISFEGAAERTAMFMQGMAVDPALGGFVRQLFPNLYR